MRCRVVRPVILVLATMTLAVSWTPRCDAGIIWDTGAANLLPGATPNDVTLLNWASGNFSDQRPEARVVVPFRVSANTVIRQVNADWVNFGQAGKTVNYTIWQRTGLDAPTTILQSGVLGRYEAGVNDPRNSGLDGFSILHQYRTNIPIAKGDYYFSIYADGIGPGNTTGHAYLGWSTGGILQDPSLLQDFIWRSSTFPPGFEMYRLGPNYQPGPDMTDPRDLYVPSFTLQDKPTATPERATLTLLCLAGAALLTYGCRRSKPSPSA
jgi:hypothetical protein